MMEYKGFQIPTYIGEIVLTLHPGYSVPFVTILRPKEGGGATILTLPYTKEDLCSQTFTMSDFITKAKYTVDHMEGYQFVKEV